MEYPPDQTTVVLTTAVIRAANTLGLNQSEVARMLGLSQPTGNRLMNGEFHLRQLRTEWQLALIFVRVYRGLEGVLGDVDAARNWLSQYHHTFNSRPRDLLQRVEGLVRVVTYIEAYRELQ